jgi:hypothetical protein
MSMTISPGLSTEQLAEPQALRVDPCELQLMIRGARESTSQVAQIFRGMFLAFIDQKGLKMVSG